MSMISRMRWNTVRLDSSNEQFARRRLDDVPMLGRVATENLGKQLEGNNSSLTVFALPMRVLRDATESIINAGSTIPEAIWECRAEGLAGLDSPSMPYELRRNEYVQDFGEPQFSDRFKSKLVPDMPIGYLRAFRYGEVICYNVGSIDNQTRTNTVLVFDFDRP